MSELTVEKIMDGKDGTEHNSGMFVTGSECYLHQEIIDFLLAEIERIEKQTAEKWIKCSDRLPESRECVMWYDKAFDEIIICSLKFPQQHDGDLTHWQPLPPPPE